MTMDKSRLGEDERERYNGAPTRGESEVVSVHRLRPLSDYVSGDFADNARLIDDNAEMSDLEDEIVSLSSRITRRIKRLSLQSSHVAGDELTLRTAVPAAAPDDPCTPPVVARGNRRLVAEATPTTQRQPTRSGLAEEANFFPRCDLSQAARSALRLVA